MPEPDDIYKYIAGWIQSRFNYHLSFSGGENENENEILLMSLADFPFFKKQSAEGRGGDSGYFPSYTGLCKLDSFYNQVQIQGNIVQPTSVKDI